MKRIFCLLSMIFLVACNDKTQDWQGYVEAESLLISTPVSGALKQLYVTEGDFVEQGKMLFTLDPEPETSVLAVARAQADAAAAELADLQKGSRPEELAVIEAQYAQVKAATDLSAQQLLRIQSLVERKLEGQEALDEIITKHELNVRRLDEVAAQLNSARLSARSDRVQVAEAKLRAARAEVEKANWQLQQKTQTAERAGLVQDVLYYPGEFVAAGHPVLNVLPPEQIKIRFFVPQAQLADIAAGGQVIVQCDGCDKPMTATITYISPQAEYTPPFIYSKKNRQKFVYLVEAKPELPEALRPGQPVDVGLTGE